MKFSKNSPAIGEGKVTSAKFQDGAEHFLLTTGSAVFLVKRAANKRAFSRLKIVSYADECYFVRDKILERRGEGMNYVS